MLGPREVVEAMADRFTELLPGEVSRLDGELGSATSGEWGTAPPGSVTYNAQPKMVTTAPRPAVETPLDLYPFVQLVPLRSPASLRVVDQDHRGRILRQRWNLQVAVWANGDGYEHVAAVRDRITLAVCELLLRHPSWETDRGSFDVVQTQLAVEVANAGRDDELASLLSAAFVTVPVDVDSLLTPARLEHGPATKVTTDTRREPYRHPALE